jgi:hypothetical protein
MYRYKTMAAVHARDYLPALRALHMHTSRAQPARLSIPLAHALLQHFVRLRDGTAFASCPAESDSTGQ